MRCYVQFDLYVLSLIYYSIQREYKERKSGKNIYV